MKKLLLIFCFCLFNVVSILAQDANWKPRELDKARTRASDLRGQFDPDNMKAYFHIGDVIDEVNERLQQIILAPNDTIDPQASAEVAMLLTSMAEEYEQTRLSFPNVTRVISIEVAVTKFKTFDVELGRGIVAYQEWLAQVKDEKTIQLYKQMIQHVRADYDSLLE